MPARFAGELLETYLSMCDYLDYPFVCPIYYYSAFRCVIPLDLSNNRLLTSDRLLATSIILTQICAIQMISHLCAANYNYFFNLQIINML